MTAAGELIDELKLKIQELKPIYLQMQEWLESRRGVWRPKTFRNEKSRLGKFLEFIGRRKITNALVKKFFIELSNSHHKCTYHHYRRFFKQVFNGIGKPELMEGVERFKYNSTPAKYFQKHQIVRIKKKLMECDPELWLCCEFIYYTFIRPGELRLLRVGDIMFDEWKICVRSQISKNKKQQYVTIPLAFRPSLTPLMHRSPNEYVFPSKKDITKPLGANTMLYRFRKILNDMGFGTEYKLYSWKHTGAVACVRGGVGVKQLQIQLRHYSLEEVDKYLRQLGVWDLEGLEEKFPGI